MGIRMKRNKSFIFDYPWRTASQRRQFVGTKCSRKEQQWYSGGKSLSSIISGALVRFYCELIHFSLQFNRMSRIAIMLDYRKHSECSRTR